MESNSIIPADNPMSMFAKDVKESLRILKEKHNELAKVVETLQEICEDLVSKYEEIEQFLTFNSKRYRKFFNKFHLKTKF